MKLLTSLALLVFCVPSWGVPQKDAAKAPIFRQGEPPVENISSPVPIVFGTAKDGLPQKLNVQGVITELTFGSAYCGTFFWSGTLKIRLLERPKGYPHEHVFVVVPCFIDLENENKYLNKTIQLEIHKLLSRYWRYKKRNPCSFGVVTNRLQSGGIPFYCTSLTTEDIREKAGK